VTHVCHPSYSGGRDPVDCGSKAGWANSAPDPTSEKTHYKKRTGGVTEGVVPEFKPQYAIKENL
jgi:hypothetical protein